jgi:serine/threonine protein kinase
MPLADMIQVGGELKPASLEALLKQRGGKFSIQEALEIIRSVVRGLAALHAAGLLHGDPSLRNVLRMSDRYILADPGLVRFIGDPGLCAAKWFYPRPRTGQPGDDLYAAGVILFALATGKEPWELGEATLDSFARSKHPVGQIISKACCRDATQRYQSAADMLADVEAALAQAVASKTHADSACSKG